MSAVVPKDLTGMVPHPTKMDCWVPGERHQGNNLCMESPMPTTSETQACTLNQFGNYCDFSMLTVIHLVQIKDALWKRGGGPEDKIIQSYPFGATRDQELPQSEVDQYAEMAIKMYLGDVTEAANRISEIITAKLVAITESPYMEPPKKPAVEVFNEISINWKIQIYNNVQRRYGGAKANLIVDAAVALMPDEMVDEFTNELLKEMGGTPKEAAVLLKTYMEEHITMMSAFAMHQSMKGNGTMQELTQLADAEVAKFNTDPGFAPALSEYLSNVPSVSDGPKPEQFVNPKRAHKKKKGKGSKRRVHLSMGNKGIKQVMGANLLRKLGAVQQQHADSTKKALLKELPLADLVEVASGEKLPDWQANLLNGMHAKADPEAPVVVRKAAYDFAEGNLVTDVVSQKVNDVLTTDDKYEEVLDRILDEYVTLDVMPEGTNTGVVAQVKAAVRKQLLEKRKATVLGELQQETSKVLELTELLETRLPMVRIELSDEYGESFYLTRKDKPEVRLSTDSIYEAVADELETTISFVEDRARGKEYLKGLNEAIIEHLVPMDLSELECDENGIVYVYRRFVVGYTAGFVKGMADSAVKIAQASAVDTQPAELG